MKDVAVLGASTYTFARAAQSQGLAYWIDCHVNAFEFFHGVTRLLVPDNPRTGVSWACRYEPDLNRTYHEMAQHYGIAVLPARPRKPRDKAKVENAVGIVERWILAALRHRRFFAVAELNEAIDDLLERLNQRVACLRRELKFGREPEKTENRVVEKGSFSRPLPFSRSPWLRQRKLRPTKRLRHGRLQSRDRNAPLDPSSMWFSPPDRDYVEEQNLRNALNALPGDQREVIVLHTWGDLTFSEISELLGVSANTAASRYRSALAKLRGSMFHKEGTCADSR